MSSEKETDALRDIIGFVDEIKEYLADMNYEAFARDRRTVRAVERCLQNLTEAAVRIGEARWSELAAGVAHHQVRGLGNVLRHEYDRIDARSIYDLADARLEELRAACIAALARE